MREKTKEEIIEEIVGRLLKNIRGTKIINSQNVVYHKDYYKYLGLDE